MKKITAVLLLSAIATPAFSADASSAADQGFYAGVTVGSSSTNNTIGAQTLTKTNGGVYGGLLGYQLNKNFAVEAQYTGASKFEYAPVTGKSDAFSLTAVGIIPLSNEFSMYGKLGFASTRSSLTNNTALSTGANRSAATYGIGAQYNVTPAIGVRLGWDAYGSALIDNAGLTQKFNSSTVTVGAIFKF
jgi:OOP family OmpA-OmpF porin